MLCFIVKILDICNLIGVHISVIFYFYRENINGMYGMQNRGGKNNSFEKNNLNRQAS